MEAGAIAAGHVAEHERHGPPPANRSSRVDPSLLGMLLFIISEVMVFGAFFTAYFFIRVVQSADWPAEGTELPKVIAGVNTCILVSPQDNAQGTIFYGLTGLHGAHVFIGLTLLLFVNIRAFRGHFTAEDHRGIEVPGIYWHFVDVMWIVVFTTVYIL
jgi:cytochrome c oxidase subunit 3